MRIDKVIKGNVFPYTVKFIPHTMKASVVFLMNDEAVIGTITEDFKYIILPNDFLSPYITDFGNLPVGRLKLNRRNSIEAKDYNSSN